MIMFYSLQFIVIPVVVWGSDGKIPKYSYVSADVA